MAFLGDGDDDDDDDETLWSGLSTYLLDYI